MKGDVVIWMSGRGITDEQWDAIFKSKEETPKSELEANAEEISKLREAETDGKD